MVAAGAAYGRSETLAGEQINLEFVSANPTGPLHLGHTRGRRSATRSAGCSTAAGAEVTREFYINDRGAQMDKFGASLMAAAHGPAVPEDGYHGAYVTDLAERVVAAHPGVPSLPEAERLRRRSARPATRCSSPSKAELDEFRTHFDVWFSERSLHESGAVRAR